MKKIKLTHAEVIPFYGNDNEIIKEVPLSSGTTILTFNVKTKTTDFPDSKALIYEQCTIYVKEEKQLNSARASIKLGNILEIDGHEERQKGKGENSKVTYKNTIVDGIKIISAGSANKSDADENLPF